MKPPGDRARRAFLLMGLAAAAAVAAGVAYLRPAPAPAARPAALPPAPPWHLTTASFGDARHGAISMLGGGQVATFLTADGGRTWRRISSQPAATAFLDRDHAVTVDLGAGSRLAISDDAGRTWQYASQPVQLSGAAVGLRPDASLLDGPYFVDPADGWWFGSRAGPGGRALWRTADGGRTWADLAPAGLPLALDGPIRPVFVDPLRGVVSVQLGVWPSLLATRDGGRTWAPVTPAWPQGSAPAGQASIVQAAVLVHGDRLLLALDLIVGRSSGPSPRLDHALSTSRDGGLTWGPWTAMPSTSTPGAAMAFDDAGSLLLPDGDRLWESADLGASWAGRALPGAPGRVSAVVSAHDGAVFVIAQSGPISRPTVALLRGPDGVGRWTELRLPSP